MSKQTSTLRTIWFFFRPYKLQILVLLVLSLVVAGLEAASVAAIYAILNAAFDLVAQQTNSLLSFFAALGRLLPIEDKFIAFCALLLLLALLSFAVNIVYLNYRVRFAVRLVESNQSKVFDRFIEADYQYFIGHKQGELIYNIHSAPTGISSLVGAVTKLVSYGILSISVLFLLFTLSWKGTLLVLAAGLGYQYFTRSLGKKISYHAAKGEMEAGREVGVTLNESISGIKQVKAFATEDDWKDRFGKAIRNTWHHYMKRNIWEQIPGSVLTLVTYLSVGVIAISMKLITQANFVEAIPLFGTFVFAILKLSPMVSSLGNLGMQIMAALPNCETVYSIRNEKITFIEDGKKELESFKSDIRFENVSFSYQGRAQTLENVSFLLPKGTSTAIVGRSGEGKTTIVNLMLRLFEVDRGEIKIDGSNIKEYRLGSWLQNIGYVSQDTFILNDTIENNITFRSTRFSHDDVVRAAKYAEAHQFISELPDGYNTMVGDKGMRLSGGQAQRIAIARAMIRQPQILIFDEATNNLDHISEIAVQKAIDDISKDHTVITIAHRLSTIVNADKILVLENGRLVEQGTHQQLLEKRGLYWQLYLGGPATNVKQPVGERP